MTEGNIFVTKKRNWVNSWWRLEDESYEKIIFICFDNFCLSFMHDFLLFAKHVRWRHRLLSFRQLRVKRHAFILHRCNFWPFTSFIDICFHQKSLRCKILENSILCTFPKIRRQAIERWANSKWQAFLLLGDEPNFLRNRRHLVKVKSNFGESVFWWNRYKTYFLLSLV